ncbi:MAG: hypothetical protein HUU01_22115 [Saprospiraceae bacterium]|nr:hypothetical protein [Saprospiraceae bacterium]
MRRRRVWQAAELVWQLVGTAVREGRFAGCQTMVAACQTTRRSACHCRQFWVLKQFFTGSKSTQLRFYPDGTGEMWWVGIQNADKHFVLTAWSVSDDCSTLSFDAGQGKPGNFNIVKHTGEQLEIDGYMVANPYRMVFKRQ